jgi:hypothetical protein
MSIDQAFIAGLDSLRVKGFNPSSKSPQVLAAHSVFSKAAATVQFDPRFPEQGPIYASQLILKAYAGK